MFPYDVNALNNLDLNNLRQLQPNTSYRNAQTLSLHFDLTDMSPASVIFTSSNEMTLFHCAGRFVVGM